MEDKNRVIINKDLKSKCYNDIIENEMKETFLGGFKTLHKDPFFASVVMDKSSLVALEKKLRKNTEQMFYSQGDLTGIRHHAYWSKKYKCFLGWRVVPSNLKEEPFGYSLKLEQELS